MLASQVNLTEAQIYNENVVAFAKREVYHELKVGAPSWASWEAYFRQIDHKPMLRIMAAHLDRTWLGKHGMMVPTEWPQDFDERAPYVPATKIEDAEPETPAHRANVVRMALMNAGFVPKEYRHNRPVQPHELVGEMRERRQKEVDAEMSKIHQIASEPLPPLSETARAIFDK